MIRTGADRLADHVRLFAGRRLGLVANHGSRDRALISTAERLAGLPGTKLVRLFAPEHGLAGMLQDGEADRDGTDPATGLPVVSLYGPRQRPDPDHLAGLDAVAYDIRDVGCRAYTFLATLLAVLGAAAEAGVEVIVLDRPNPAGGVVEGGGVAAGEESFVAPLDVPLRHGLTLGEIARLYAAETGLPPPAVVPVAGWARQPDRGVDPWIAPSPNLPTAMAALAYTGTVLVEGTGLSEGRGTTRPFTLVGAPGLDAVALAARINGCPAVRAWPMAFRPAAAKHAGLVCQGVEFWIEDRARFRALPIALHLMGFVRDRNPDALAVTPWTRRLAGGPALADWCASPGARPDEMLAAWRAEEDRFRARVAPHLLYGPLCPGSEV